MTETQKDKVLERIKKALFGIIITVNVVLIGVSVWILATGTVQTSESIKTKKSDSQGVARRKFIRKERDAAYISLNSRPSGVKVFINGYFKARTPADIKITSVSEVPRQYSIKLILPGYHSWERKVILTRGKTKEFSIKLVKR